MQFTNYFLASIISFSGLAIGMLLVKIAPEEQKPLKKYFSLLGKLILFLIFIFLLPYYLNSKLNLAIMAACFLFLSLVEYKIHDLPRKSAISYAALGVLFFLSSKNTNLFTIESSLILLYGLPAASLLHSKKGRNQYKFLYYNSLFIITANILFFI